MPSDEWAMWLFAYTLLYLPSLRRDCHACLSKTSLTLLITPVFQFLMPGINVWVIAALTVSFWKIYQLYKETATTGNKRKERSIVNDWLSQNSLISKGKVTGDEVVFLCVSVFVLDEPLQNNLGTSSEIFARSLENFGYYQTPTKNPGTLRIKMPCL